MGAVSQPAPTRHLAATTVVFEHVALLGGLNGSNHSLNTQRAKAEVVVGAN